MMPEVQPHTVDAAGKTFRYVLPNGWWPIPLQDAADRHLAIRKLVERQAGGRPDAAQLKPVLIAETEKQAVAAAQGGGIVLAFSLMRVNDTMLPASMLCIDLTGVLPPYDQENPARSLDVLLTDGFIRLDGHRMVTYRRERLTRGLPGVLEADAFEQLQVDYLQAVPGFGIVKTAFTTPLPQAQTQWVTLFDEIVQFHAAG
jgi:hypothetical protein